MRSIVSSLLLALSQIEAHSLKDFGGIEGVDTNKAATANAKAFSNAFDAATKQLKGDNTIHIPAGETYTLFPVIASDIHNVNIIIDGTILCAQDEVAWTARENNRAYNMFHLTDVTELHFSGNGLVEGRGFAWWTRQFMLKNPHGRPHLMYMRRAEHVSFRGIKWQNSPMYHFLVEDINDFVFEDFEINVDVWGQMNLAYLFGKQLGMPTDLLPDAGFPMFPLNTDGIDPSGSNVYIRNVNITNYDDAVAVKPAHNTNKIAKCAENITVEDSYVFNSVGMTIGSVPPRESFACIRNVYFKNVVMDYPLKGIYLKTNPGHKGNGIIENIKYENFKMNTPVWWAIYIGPQQQEQPSGAGPGCMLYPLIPECETQPRVPFKNITLVNIEGTNSLLPPGIIRCNETHPCHEFTFNNVQMSGWWDWFGYGYITEHIYGESINSYPDPGFKNEHGLVEERHYKYRSARMIQNVAVLVSDIVLSGMDLLKIRKFVSLF